MKMEALTTLHREGPNDQEGLPDQPGLFVRQGRRRPRRGRAGARSVPTSRSSATICTRCRRCKDFSPYVAKIKASGADTVITGNWGNDMALLIKAGKDAGLKVNWAIRIYAGVPTATAIGRCRAVRHVGIRCPNTTRQCRAELDQTSAAFKKRYHGDDDEYAYWPPKTHVRHARRRRPRKAQVERSGQGGQGARRHEDRNACDGEVEMRADNHQSAAAAVVSTLSRRWQERQVRPGEDRLGWQTDTEMDAQATALPTTCQMKRPMTSPGLPLASRRTCGCVRAAIAAVTAAGARSAGHSVRASSSSFSLLNGIIYGLLLFMLSSGLTLIFSMMGVLNFAHASFFMLGALFRVPDRPLDRLLAGACRRAAAGAACVGALVERYRLAPRAQVRPRGRTPVHVRPRLPDRGVVHDGLGPQRRGQPGPRGHRRPAVHALRHAASPRTRAS